MLDLRLSRARIVATGDAERRRRERDLHDGVQQRLLALTYDLQVAREGAKRDATVAVIAPLDDASGQAHAAHEELRELAHGIYPAVLAETGLRRALETLVDRSPVPLRLFATVEGRCSTTAETTAYVVVDESVGDAARRRASHVTVRVARDEGLIVVEVDDDGRKPDGPVVHCADRVGAAGGRMSLSPLSTEGMRVRVRAEIPCA